MRVFIPKTMVSAMLNPYCDMVPEWRLGELKEQIANLKQRLADLNEHEYEQIWKSAQRQYELAEQLSAQNKVLVDENKFLVEEVERFQRHWIPGYQLQ
jgi:hypothetical protein